MIPAMKHAIAHWLNDDQWCTVRPPLEHSDRDGGGAPDRTVDGSQLHYAGSIAIDSIDAHAALANWNPTDAKARPIIY
jgi:hypothetical protein